MLIETLLRKDQKEVEVEETSSIEEEQISLLEDSVAFSLISKSNTVNNFKTGRMLIEKNHSNRIFQSQDSFRGL